MNCVFVWMSELNAHYLLSDLHKPRATGVSPVVGAPRHSMEDTSSFITATHFYIFCE